MTCDIPDSLCNVSEYVSAKTTDVLKSFPELKLKFVLG